MIFNATNFYHCYNLNDYYNIVYSYVNIKSNCNKYVTMITNQQNMYLKVIIQYRDYIFRIALTHL